MNKWLNKVSNLFERVRGDQRGITGLETAIVLIAFVVVSSVFAIAALSTGLFTTDKAKSTIHAGLAETQGTMELKGSVIATSATTGSAGTISDLAFWVANAAGGSFAQARGGCLRGFLGAEQTGGDYGKSKHRSDHHKGNQDDGGLQTGDAPLVSPRPPK